MNPRGATSLYTASARQARLRQSILQIAFKGKRLTTDSADDADKRRNPSVKSA